MSNATFIVLVSTCIFLWTAQSETGLLAERKLLLKAEKGNRSRALAHERSEGHEEDAETIHSTEKREDDKKEEGTEKCEHEEELKEKIVSMREVEAEILQFTIAVLVAFFIFAYVAILYLVNFPDANIRSYIYQMLSSTMSIFLAVTINMASFSFWLEQALPAKPPFGMGIKVGELQEFIVGVLTFIGVLVLINILCNYFQTSKHYCKAIRIIGGHIAAFSGITTFGTLQIAVDESANSVFKDWKLSVLVFAAAILFTATQCTKCFRDKQFGEFDWLQPTGPRSARSNEYCSVPSGDRAVDEDRQKLNREEREKQEWRRDICEAEDDASALIMSFLACQFAIFQVCGHYVPLPPHRDVHKYTWDEVRLLCYANLIFLLFLIIAMFLRRSIPAIEQAGGRDPTGVYMRTMGAAQSFCAMSLAWSALRLGDWIVAMVLNGTALNSHDMVHLVSAAALTCISVCSVILLDQLADKAKEEGDKLKQDQRPSTKSDLLRAKSRISSAAADSLFELDTMQKTWKKLQHEYKDVSNFERALRTVIESFGLLVGLCWEKASHAAIDTIVDGNEVLRSHSVLSKFFAAVLVVLVMFPGWLWYIVPSAELSVADHALNMEMECCASGATLQKREQWVMKAMKGCQKEDAEQLFNFVTEQLRLQDQSKLSFAKTESQN